MQDCSRLFGIELKERYEVLSPDLARWRREHPGHDTTPPHAGKYPNQVDLVIGVVYSHEEPHGLIDPDKAYEIACSGTYWVWNGPRGAGQWVEIGGPEAVLRYLASKLHEDGREFEVYWPDANPKPDEFHRHDIIQVTPWRELLRRHFDRHAYISDVDSVIHKDYRR